LTVAKVCSKSNLCK